MKKTQSVDFSSNPYYESNFKFYDNKLIEAINQNDEDCHRFFTLLCVCHTVMAEDKNGILAYQAQSPDEGALVSAARNFGFVFKVKKFQIIKIFFKVKKSFFLKSRTPKTITVIIGGKEKTYDVLNILDFNNVRKRMSVS